MSLLVNQLGEKLAAMTERAEKAEAQVQRVREVCEQDSVVADVDGQEFTMVEVSDILRALGGRR